LPADRHLSRAQFPDEAFPEEGGNPPTGPRSSLAQLHALRSAPTVPSLLAGGDSEPFDEWAVREGVTRDPDTYEAYLEIAPHNVELAKRAYRDRI
jgi:hypothetical protein